MKDFKLTNYAQMFLTVMTVIAVCTSGFTGCGETSDDSVVIIDDVDPNAPAQTCSGAPLGATKDQICEVGYKGAVLYVCTASGWTEKSNTCEKIVDDCNGQSTQQKVNFKDDIKPLIERHCMNCHAQNQLNTYEVAKQWANDSIRRLNLNTGNLEFMPKNAAPLSADERGLYDSWRANGLVEENECAEGNDGYGNQFRTLDIPYIEAEALRDIGNVDVRDQPNTRWAVLTHKYNLRSSVQEMDYFVDGINLTLNSISQERGLSQVTQVDNRRSLYRIDLDAFGLTANDWDKILRQEFFNLESNTVRGRQLKLLTGSRIPWLHADNLIFTALGGNICQSGATSTTNRCDPNLRGAFLYYDLLDFPIGQNRVDRRFSDLVNLQIAYVGLNFQEEVDNFDVNFLGFFGSSISLNKNRLLVRAETDDGRFWITFDTNSNAAPEQNLFEFPLLVETRGQAIFDFQASESIFSLENGTDAYFLSDANGVAADFAPLDTVFDNQTPGFDPTIRAPFSCFRCHVNGILPASDQVRDSIVGVPSDLTRDDIELVEAHYKNIGNQLFTNDNLELKRVKEELKHDPGQPDPVNYASDRMRKDYSLAEVAAHTGLSPAEFLRRMNSSTAVRNQISQLATGGKISFQQLVNTYPDIIKDFRLDQDPIDQ